MRLPRTDCAVPLLAAAVLLGSSGCASLRRPDDPWFGRDKLYHFAVSAAIGGGATQAAHEQDWNDVDAGAGAIGLAFVIGAGKEAHDKNVKRTYWSWKDMVWNVLGALAGAAAVSWAN